MFFDRWGLYANRVFIFFEATPPRWVHCKKQRKPVKLKIIKHLRGVDFPNNFNRGCLKKSGFNHFTAFQSCFEAHISLSSSSHLHESHKIQMAKVIKLGFHLLKIQWQKMKYTSTIQIHGPMDTDALINYFKTNSK